MKAKKKKILFIYDSMYTFVQKDINLLERRYELEKFNFPFYINNLESYILLFKLIQKTIETDIIICRFVGNHAFIATILSKIFNKKILIIVGGWDVANIPKLNYGRFNSNWYIKYFTKFALKNANRILVVDKGLKNDIINNANLKADNVECVYNGYDTSFWKPDETIDRHLILTVATAKEVNRVKLKGLHIFVKTASYFPQEKFVVVGVSGKAEKYLNEISSSNVLLLKSVSQNKLLTLYQKSKVYCQLSLREGLPNSLCEAMSCGCIPVGTYVQGIKTAIGNAGYFTEYENESLTVKAIQKSLQDSQDMGDKARKRIIEKFPIKKREQKFFEIIESVN